MPVHPIIKATSLTKRYGDTVAVDRLSLTVDRGEVYALLGLNGAGKTTTIRMLLGMIRPSDGEVSLFGSPVRSGRSAMWADVGYLVETPAAYPDLTVTENLRLAARLRGLRDQHAVDDVVRRLDLGRHAEHRARTLSLGNARRLGLAKALLHRPALLILDEPANGLDPAGVAEIRHLLHDLAHEEGVTVVLSSHILTEVARIATRIGVLDRGRLVREVGAHELSAQARPRLNLSTRDDQAAVKSLREAGFTPESNGEAGLLLADERAVTRPDDVAALLVEAGLAPTRLVVEQDDLETYFLRLVGHAETVTR